MYSTGILLYELLFNNEKRTNGVDHDPLPNQMKANVKFGDARFKWGEPFCLKGHKLIQESKQTKLKC